MPRRSRPLPSSLLSVFIQTIHIHVEITFRLVQDLEDLLQGGDGGVEGGEDVSDGQLELALRCEELVHGRVEQLRCMDSEGWSGECPTLHLWSIL